MADFRSGRVSSARSARSLPSYSPACKQEMKKMLTTKKSKSKTRISPKCKKTVELYKSSHNIGKRTAADRVGSYKDTETALVYPANFWEPVKIDDSSDSSPDVVKKRPAPPAQPVAPPPPKPVVKRVLIPVSSSESESDDDDPDRLPFLTRTKLKELKVVLEKKNPLPLSLKRPILNPTFAKIKTKSPKTKGAGKSISRINSLPMPQKSSRSPSKPSSPKSISKNKVLEVKNDKKTKTKLLDKIKSGLSKHPKKNSPAEKKNSLIGKVTSPAGKKISPAGKKLPKAAKKNTPAGKCISPGGKKLSPPVKKTSQSVKKMSPETKKSTGKKTPSPKKNSPQSKTSTATKIKKVFLLKKNTESKKKSTNVSPEKIPKTKDRVDTRTGKVIIPKKKQKLLPKDDLQTKKEISNAIKKKQADNMKKNMPESKTSKGSVSKSKGRISPAETKKLNRGTTKAARKGKKVVVPRAVRIKRTACLNAVAIVSALYANDESTAEKKSDIPKEVDANGIEDDKMSVVSSVSSSCPSYGSSSDSEVQFPKLEKLKKELRKKKGKKVINKKKTVAKKARKQTSKNRNLKKKQATMKRNVRRKRSLSSSSAEDISSSSEEEEQEEERKLWPPPKRMASLNAQAIWAATSDDWPSKDKKSPKESPPAKKINSGRVMKEGKKRNESSASDDSKAKLKTPDKGKSSPSKKSTQESTVASAVFEFKDDERKGEKNKIQNQSKNTSQGAPKMNGAGPTKHVHTIQTKSRSARCSPDVQVIDVTHMSPPSQMISQGNKQSQPPTQQRMPTQQNLPQKQHLPANYQVHSSYRSPSQGSQQSPSYPQAYNNQPTPQQQPQQHQQQQYTGYDGQNQSQQHYQHQQNQQQTHYQQHYQQGYQKNIGQPAQQYANLTQQQNIVQQQSYNPFMHQNLQAHQQSQQPSFPPQPTDSPFKPVVGANQSLMPHMQHTSSSSSQIAKHSYMDNKGAQSPSSHGSYQQGFSHRSGAGAMYPYTHAGTQDGRNEQHSQMPAHHQTTMYKFSSMGSMLGPAPNAYSSAFTLPDFSRQPYGSFYPMGGSMMQPLDETCYISPPFTYHVHQQQVKVLVHNPQQLGQHGAIPPPLPLPAIEMGKTSKPMDRLTSRYGSNDCHSSEHSKGVDACCTCRRPSSYCHGNCNTNHCHVHCSNVDCGHRGNQSRPETCPSCHGGERQSDRVASIMPAERHSSADRSDSSRSEVSSVPTAKRSQKAVLASGDASSDRSASVNSQNSVKSSSSTPTSSKPSVPRSDGQKLKDKPCSCKQNNEKKTSRSAESRKRSGVDSSPLKNWTEESSDKTKSSKAAKMSVVGDSEKNRNMKCMSNPSLHKNVIPRPILNGSNSSPTELKKTKAQTTSESVPNSNVTPKSKKSIGSSTSPRSTLKLNGKKAPDSSPSKKTSANSSRKEYVSPGKPDNGKAKKNIPSEMTPSKVKELPISKESQLKVEVQDNSLDKVETSKALIKRKSTSPPKSPSKRKVESPKQCTNKQDAAKTKLDLSKRESPKAKLEANKNDSPKHKLTCGKAVEPLPKLFGKRKSESPKLKSDNVRKEDSVVRNGGKRKSESPKSGDEVSKKKKGISLSPIPLPMKYKWTWEGEVEIKMIEKKNEAEAEERHYYPAMRHEDGDIIKVRDCVLLRSGPKASDLPYIAKITALWEQKATKAMMMSILWYYRPEHADAERLPSHVPAEIFASKHKDETNVACIDDRCFVLTLNEYCRYRGEIKRMQESAPVRPAIVPSEPDAENPRRIPPFHQHPESIFLCRRVYDFKLRRVLKNPLP